MLFEEIMKNYFKCKIVFFLFVRLDCFCQDFFFFFTIKIFDF